VNTETATVEAYDRVAAQWCAKHDGARFWELAADRLLVRLPEPATVLEIGSGSGKTAAWMRSMGYRWIGTDVSAGMLQQAKRNAPGVPLLQATPYQLPFGPVMDGVWATASLLHVPRHRIGEALTGVAGVLKPGGWVFITVKEGDGDETVPEGRTFTYWPEPEFTTQLCAAGLHTELFWRDYRRTAATSGAWPSWLCYLARKGN